MQDLLYAHVCWLNSVESESVNRLWARIYSMSHATTQRLDRRRRSSWTRRIYDGVLHQSTNSVASLLLFFYANHFVYSDILHRELSATWQQYSPYQCNSPTVACPWSYKLFGGTCKCRMNYLTVARVFVCRAIVVAFDKIAIEHYLSHTHSMCVVLYILQCKKRTYIHWVLGVCMSIRGCSLAIYSI